MVPCNSNHSKHFFVSISVAHDVISRSPYEHSENNTVDTTKAGTIQKGVGFVRKPLFICVVTFGSALGDHDCEDHSIHDRMAKMIPIKSQHSYDGAYMLIRACLVLCTSKLVAVAKVWVFRCDAKTRIEYIYAKCACG